MTEGVDQMTIGEMFTGSVFRVPKFQRGYSWEKSQVRDLLEDLEYTYRQRYEQKRPGFKHYFGTIIIQEQGMKQTQANDFEAYDIIDGQQRITTVSIIMSVINEEFDRISNSDLENDWDDDPGEMYTQNRKKFITNGCERVELDSKFKGTFRKLVVDEQSISANPNANIYQRRLVEAKESVQDWILGWREELYFESDTADDYFNFLLDIRKVVKDALDITVRTVDDQSEVGRIFEGVNDRGKDLTTLDRIKNYLVYAANRIDDEELAEKVYRKVGEVVENITTRGGTDKDIESFVSDHWMVFTGERILARQSNNEYTTIHRRIKNVGRHATLSRNPDGVALWIEEYLNSLTDCSEAYAQISNPITTIDPSRHDNGKEIVGLLDGINQLPVSGNFTPLLMAGYRHFGLSDQYLKLLRLCEAFLVRVYNITNRRTNASKGKLYRHAFFIEWADSQELCHEVFAEEPKNLGANSAEEALNDACSMIESEMGKHCPDIRFRECLKEGDLFEGSTSDGSWTGVRGKDAVRYLLYKYEKHLREGAEHSETRQLPRFSEWKKDGITIEHIHAQESTEPTETDGLIHALGNLALLDPGENSSAGNRPYKEKYERIYSNSANLMISELPDPSTGWAEDKIRIRTEKLTNFALEEWSPKTRVHVQVENSDNISQENLDSLIREIRIYHGRAHNFRVPSISISNNGADANGNWKIVNRCENCKSTRVMLNSDSDWDAECSGCGQSLERPVYEIRETEWVN